MNLQHDDGTDKRLGFWSFTQTTNIQIGIKLVLILLIYLGNIIVEWTQYRVVINPQVSWISVARRGLLTAGDGQFTDTVYTNCLHTSNLRSQISQVYRCST